METAKILLDKLPEKVCEDVYKSALKPPLVQVGHVLEDITYALKFFSLPFKMLGFTAETLYPKYQEFLIDSFKKVPAENLSKPSSQIVGPLLENVMYSFDNDELRELYSCLLSSAMNTDLKKDAHPAFVNIIQQLSNVDICILKALKKKSFVPFVQIDFVDNDSVPILTIHEPAVLIDDCDCTHEHITACLKNLERLGLLKFSNLVLAFGDRDKIADILSHPAYSSYHSTMKYLKENNLKINTGEFQIKNGNILATPFGFLFMKTCLNQI